MSNQLSTNKSGAEFCAWFFGGTAGHPKMGAVIKTKPSTQTSGKNNY
jgi:hypothetical protein